MSNRPSLAVAFVVALISVGAAPARAESDACGVLAPRYEPKAARPAERQTARWLGGARLSRPVAAPCPPSRRPVDA